LVSTDRKQLFANEKMSTKMPCCFLFCCGWKIRANFDELWESWAQNITDAADLQEEAWIFKYFPCNKQRMF
jgi:hypothetical protein